ncbi:hypothetical protein [Pseudodesulfovibrio sp.]|uniref:hypothetical protein n=1 Tax=Pseudodesulfovibrio sp. TaxID=2035812 RepID=UPI002607AA02|nr:hypothetical protein [Pseudodesulfovibrio sp.]MDD3313794.1 hypothetical protein [Pseudodesulfovibrio sp.]
MLLARSCEAATAQAPGSGNRRAWWLFLWLAVICHYDAFVIGKYALVPYSDFLDSGFIVNLKLYGEMLRDHGLFQWFQPLLGGMPSSVSLQPAWNARSVLAMVAPVWLVVAVVKSAACLMAGYGLFRLLRRWFGLDPDAAFAVGTIFVFSSPWAYNYTWMCYFPLCIVHVKEMIDARTSLRGRLGRLALFLVMAFGTIPVFTLPGFSVGHACFILLFDRSDRRWRHLAAAFLLWTGYALIYAPYFLGLLQYTPEVSRTYDMHYDGFGAALASFGRIVSSVRDYPALALGLFVLPSVRFSSDARRALGFTLVPLFLCTLMASDFFVLFKDSLIAKMDLGHAIQLFYFGVPLTAGVVFRDMRRGGRRPNLIWAVAAVLLLRVFCNEAQMLRDAALLAVALAAVFLRRGEGARRSLALLAGAAACLVLSLLINNQREELKFTHVPFARSFGEYGVLNAMAGTRLENDFRVACLDVHPSVARYAGLDTVGARYVLTNRYYKEYLARCLDPLLGPDGRAAYVKSQYDVYTTPREDNRNDLLFESYYPDKIRSVTDWNMPMLLGLGVRYLISPKRVEGMGRYASSSVIDQGAELPGLLSGTRVGTYYSLPLRIYAVRHPYGLARFASEARRFATREAVLEAMAGADEQAMRGSVFLYDDDVPEGAFGAPGAGVPAATGAVAEVLRDPDAMTVAGEADGPGYVFLAVNFDRRWRCHASGEELKIVRANHAFQAVRIDRAGPFRLTFTYAAPLIAWAGLATAAGVLLMFCAPLLLARRSVAEASVRGDVCLFAHQGPHSGRWLLAGGLGASLAWGLGFYLFIYRRYVDVPLAPYGYLFVQLTVMGLLLSAWIWFASRRG